MKTSEGRLSRPRWRFVNSGVTRILTGSLAGQGVVLAISPILTRLYGPNDFGLLAVITSMSAVLGAVATLSWERGIVLPHSDVLARSLFRLAVASTLAVSLVVAVAAFVARDALSRLLSVEEFAMYWWTLPLTVLAIGLFRAYTSWLVRKRQYGGLAIRNAAQGLTQAAFNLAAPLAGLGPLGLILGPAIGRFAGLGGILGRREKVPHPTARTLRVAAARYRKFPLVSTWSSLLNSFGLQAPVLFFSAFYGAAELGLVALTIRVMAAPVGILTDAVSQYFEGAFGMALRNRNRSLVRMVATISLRCSLLALAGGLIVAFAGPWLFTLVFGAQWEQAGVYAQVMVWGYVAQLAVSPISRGLLLLERVGLQLGWDSGRLILTNGSILVAGLLGAPALGALTALTAAQIVCYGVLLVMVLICARNRDARRGQQPVIAG
ncbi:lipopolysaccharide biosynthesis protein [Diaminobutyricibacter sp. McL0618]|uniref:lipopolysaccharide biosynthesis protein n=1 Tax=Leifsonia sp. McL0618 TaxID=3415677 RepID=UPI003CF729ED